MICYFIILQVCVCVCARALVSVQCALMLNATTNATVKVLGKNIHRSYVIPRTSWVNDYTAYSSATFSLSRNTTPRNRRFSEATDIATGNNFLAVTNPLWLYFKPMTSALWHVWYCRLAWRLERVRRQTNDLPETMSLHNRCPRENGTVNRNVYIWYRLWVSKRRWCWIIGTIMWCLSTRVFHCLGFEPVWLFQRKHTYLSRQIPQHCQWTAFLPSRRYSIK